MDPFGGPLWPDPEVALPPLSAAPPRTGPLPKVQFTVEWIGPRSLAAATVAPLRGPDWTAALGAPEMWRMAPADEQWEPLDAVTVGSYDSLAVAWDLLSERGELTSAAAEHLYRVCEQVGSTLQRRAAPMPVAKEVDRQVRTLKEIRDGLDTGISAMVLPLNGTFAEAEVWKCASALGMSMSPECEFQWRSEHQLGFSLTPAGSHDRFSFGQAQRGVAHEGLQLGFRLPTTPEPVETWRVMQRAAAVLANRLGGRVTDEDGAPLTNAKAEHWVRELEAADGALRRAGFTPGSAEALRLWV